MSVLTYENSNFVLVGAITQICYGKLTEMEKLLPSMPEPKKRNTENFIMAQRGLMNLILPKARLGERVDDMVRSSTKEVAQAIVVLSSNTIAGEKKESPLNLFNSKCIFARSLGVCNEFNATNQKKILRCNEIINLPQSEEMQRKIATSEIASYKRMEGLMAEMEKLIRENIAKIESSAKK